MNKKIFSKNTIAYCLVLLIIGSYIYCYANASHFQKHQDTDSCTICQLVEALKTTNSKVNNNVSTIFYPAIIILTYTYVLKYVCNQTLVGLKVRLDD